MTAVWERESEVLAERRWFFTDQTTAGWTGLPDAWPSVLRLYLEAVELGDRVARSLYLPPHTDHPAAS